MPDSILSILEYELSRAASELGAATDDAVFTWNGADYPCTWVRIQQEFVVPGALSEIGALTLTVQKTNLPTDVPKLHDHVIFDGDTYEIQVIKDGSGGSVVYTCWPPGKLG